MAEIRSAERNAALDEAAILSGRGAIATINPSLVSLIAGAIRRLTPAIEVSREIDPDSAALRPRAGTRDLAL